MLACRNSCVIDIGRWLLVQKPSGVVPRREAVVGSTTAVTAILLLILAGALRLLRLGAWSFWADEIFTLRDAQNLSNVKGYPVGYALIGQVVKLFGTSEFAARLLPAVVGAVSVPVIYLIGKRLFSQRAALLAALLLALLSFHIYYSQYARYYTPLVLLATLGMWAAFEGIERNDKRWLVGAVLLTGLAFWTHWTAGLMAPALLLYLVWSAKGAEKPAGLGAANVAILLGPFVVGGLVLATRMGRFLAGWRGDAPFSFLRLLLIFAKVVDRMEPTVLICAAVAVWLLMIERDRRVKWLLPFAALPILVVVGFVGFSQGGSRFAIVSLPAVVLLAGEGMDRLIRYASSGYRTFAWALVALVVISLAMKDVRYFTTERGQRPQWREAIAWAMAQEPDADFIVTTPEIFEHYTGRTAGALRDFDDAVLARELSDASLGTTWIIVERTANVAPTPSQCEVLAERAELVKAFPLRVRFFLDYSVHVFRARH